MPARIVAVLAFTLTLVAAPKKKVTLEDVTATRPAAQAKPIWSPDGKRFAYTQTKKVWLYDAVTGQRTELVYIDKLEGLAKKPAPSEAFHWQNRRVTEDKVQWAPSGKELLISANDDLFWHPIDTGKTEQLTATSAAERDPRLSPDGRRVSFRLDHDLYSLDLASRRVTRLTFDGSATTWNAQVDWVYPEELDLGRAHWWSPDSRHIAYLQFDVSPEPVHPQVDLGRAVYEPQRYPKAGTSNPRVRLGVVPAAGKKTRWMDLGGTKDTLIARVDWLPDSKQIAVQRLNRVQNRLELLFVDSTSGDARVVLEEKDPQWINVGDDLTFLPKRGQFLWSSERDGFRHLYLYSLDGKLIRQITRGNWEVSSVVSTDEASGDVWFIGTAESPLERHLYRINIDSGALQRLTKTAGTHAVSMSPTSEYYIDTFSSLTEPPRATVHARDGNELRVYREANRAPIEQYDLAPIEIVQVKASDGTPMYAKLIRPAGFTPGRKYPAIVIVYGGPQAQSVRNTWLGLNWEQALAHRGFVIWQLDNRGSAGRGHKFESPLYRRFGKVELEDQQRGIQHLVSLGFVDSSRIGIYGWSYGGFMTLYSLLHAPDLFRAGIAGAPVVDWRLYDTIYTERYLGLPSENEEGYKASSPIHFVKNLKAALMLAHNAEDDNVLFQNTMQMIDALQKEGKQFDLLLYPQKAHAVTGAAQKHMLQAMTAFFERHLQPGRTD